MENASKALIMAGGILIAMITVSMFYFMFNRLSQYKGITETNYSQEELKAFNQGFEAYNKKLMYGSEVISVINKAMNNNANNGFEYDATRNKWVSSDSSSDYYINVEIKLKEDLNITESKYDKYGKIIEKYNQVVKKSGILKAGQKYSLNDNYDKIKNVIIDAVSGTTEAGESYDNAKSAVTDYNADGSYTITYYPAAQFKRMAFSCTGVTYYSGSGQNGRIKSMSFEQYK